MKGQLEIKKFICWWCFFDEKENLCSAYLLLQRGPWTWEHVSKCNKSLTFGDLSLKSLNFVKKCFVN